MKIKFIFNIFMQTLKVSQDCPSFKIYGWRNSFNNILFLQHSFPSSLVARDSQFPLGLCSSADINNQNLLYLIWKESFVNIIVTMANVATQLILTNLLYTTFWMSDNLPLKWKLCSDCTKLHEEVKCMNFRCLPSDCCKWVWCCNFAKIHTGPSSWECSAVENNPCNTQHTTICQ